MKYIISILLIFITGILTYIFTPRPYIVHYHANFSVYIDGKRWDFSPNFYMEEVSRCNVEQGITPNDRIHLHDNNGGLVHVHMAASTWGDLFANLYWGIGKDYIQTDHNNYYASDTTNHLYYILNGSVIMNPMNIAVGSADRLLVWYGTGDEQDIVKKWDTLVEKDAIVHNAKNDPASCGANTYGGGIIGTMYNKMNRLIGHKE